MTATEAIDRFYDEMEEFIYVIYDEFPRATKREMIEYLIRGLSSCRNIVEEEILADEKDQ